MGPTWVKIRCEDAYNIYRFVMQEWYPCRQTPALKAENLSKGKGVGENDLCFYRYSSSAVAHQYFYWLSATNGSELLNPLSSKNVNNVKTKYILPAAFGDYPYWGFRFRNILDVIYSDDVFFKDEVDHINPKYKTKTLEAWKDEECGHYIHVYENVYYFTLAVPWMRGGITWASAATVWA